MINKFAHCTIFENYKKLGNGWKGDGFRSMKLMNYINLLYM